MKVRDTYLSNLIREEHKFDFGVFYFFDDYIISEIYEGEIFEWNKACEVIKACKQFYKKKHQKINYISNRINDYSIKPQDWLTYLNQYDLLNIFAVVIHRKTAIHNLIMERLFYKGEIFSFESLLEAVNFIHEQEDLVHVTDFKKLKEN
ncbi:hypothetical protein ACFSYG_16765 [Leeuwenhoekiella polynyae]|uniref:SpoIIAA-like protein n=1 Tax=Leeuwenhoekiella polynyae TaxID=1550906 RepID=A0A4Q0P160_9FLAO|nr:hypothetical protein [Leeuwenhoekiella polynyae]RXG20214.1 hypothetical protein DSM02_2650 [Leeuwenhoekiella polynyae]